MKFNWPNKIIFLYGCCMALAGCKQTPPPITVVLDIKDKKITSTQLDSAMQVLRRRLLLLNDEKASITILADKKQIIVESSVIKGRKDIAYLTTHGKVAFRECYITSEIYPLLASGMKAKEEPVPTSAQQAEPDVYDLLKQTPQPDKSSGLLTLNEPGAGYRYNMPQIGFVWLKDTPALRKRFALLQPYLPSKTVLLYGRSESAIKRQRDTLLELYAVKTAEESGMGNEYIASAEASYDEVGRPVIFIRLNREGTNKWSLLTRNNVNRPLTIIVDDWVYAAPIVVSEITGGVVQINGMTSIAEANLIAKAIAGGYMPLALQFNSMKSKAR
jgi:hypothetical protein